MSFILWLGIEPEKLGCMWILWADTKEQCRQRALRLFGSWWALWHGWLMAGIGKQACEGEARDDSGHKGSLTGLCSVRVVARQWERTESFVFSKWKTIFLLPLSSSRINHIWVIFNLHSKNFLILLSKVHHTSLLSRIGGAVLNINVVVQVCSCTVLYWRIS